MVQDWRCSKWWGFILRSVLGHRVVWYMVMNVLEEKAWVCLYRLSEDGCSISWPQTSVPTNHIMWSHNTEDYNFESWYSVFFHALCHYRICQKPAKYMYYAMNVPYYFKIYNHKHNHNNNNLFSIPTIHQSGYRYR